MQQKIFLTFYFLLLTFITGCQPQPTEPNISNISSTMQITSPAFDHQKPIPAIYTCQGNNTNPPLIFTDIPTNTSSLVLIVDDPDASNGDWVHWLVWNIDPAVTSIDVNSVPAGSTEGTTSFGQTGYGGPCPPSGTHRYFFKLYALDTRLDLSSTTDKAGLLNTIEGHVIDYAELVGIYEKN